MAAICASLGGIATARLMVNDPSLGISFLSVLPIVFAAARFGYAGANAASVGGIALFVLDELLAPSPYLQETRALLSALIILVAVFLGIGLGAAYVFGQRGRLRHSLAGIEAEMHELEALRTLLTPPTPPQRPGLEVAVLYIPSERGAAGDFYLVTQSVGERTLIAVGDVVGHGVGAARRAAFARTCFASFAEQTDDPAQLLELTNEVLLRTTDGPGSFVTAVCAILDPRAGSTSFALAGHPPPCLLDDARQLGGAGQPAPPLGVFASVDATVHEFELASGQGLLLFSDGLSEARSRDRRSAAAVFGMDRIETTLRRHAGAQPKRVVDALTAGVRAHAGARLADDVCATTCARSPCG